MPSNKHLLPLIAYKMATTWMATMEVLCQDFHITRFNKIKVNKTKLLLCFTRGLPGSPKITSEITDDRAKRS